MEETAWLYYLGGEIKNEMGGACGRKEVHTGF
jgi:hypothetical protein